MYDWPVKYISVKWWWLDILDCCCQKIKSYKESKHTHAHTHATSFQVTHTLHWMTPNKFFFIQCTIIIALRFAHTLRALSHFFSLSLLVHKFYAYMNVSHPVFMPFIRNVISNPMVVSHFWLLLFCKSSANNLNESQIISFSFICNGDAFFALCVCVCDQFNFCFSDKILCQTVFILEILDEIFVLLTQHRNRINLKNSMTRNATECVAYFFAGYAMAAWPGSSANLFILAIYQ